MHTIDLPQDQECVYLIPISDTHIGDPLFDEEKLQGYINWVAERPNAYIILLGDILNTATKDGLSDIYREQIKIPEACEKVWKLFEPVKDRVLAWVEGNHERRLYKQVGGYLGQLVCSKYNWLFCPDYVFLKLRLGKGKNGKPLAYTIYGIHGWGGGRTSGAKVNKLEQLGNVCLVDIYLMAHQHESCFSQNIYFVPDTRNNHILEVKRTFVSSGCFLKYGDYGLRAGYKPNKLGSPRLRLDGQRRDVHCSM